MALVEVEGRRELAIKLYCTLEEHGIEYVADFPVSEVTAQEVRTFDDHILAYDLLMLLPPFAGVGPVIDTGITDSKNFIRVDHSMRVKDAERMYAVGDSINLRGAKTAHMSVRQAKVAAANVRAEIDGLRIPRQTGTGTRARLRPARQHPELPIETELNYN